MLYCILYTKCMVLLYSRCAPSILLGGVIVYCNNELARGRCYASLLDIIGRVWCGHSLRSFLRAGASFDKRFALVCIVHGAQVY